MTSYLLSCATILIKMQRRLAMEQKMDIETKMLNDYIRGAFSSLRIWAQVYEMINPITNFRLKAKKVLFVLYLGLALSNFLFLMVLGYSVMPDGLLLKILGFLLCYLLFIGILSATSVGFVFVLRCYTITGYKSIWLFIIAFFIPQIFCAVCSTIYIGL